ncbi:PQQ-binding-like beta-propeller repeat protein [Collimonas pratensis]|uniref:pilus assembly protein n=1 Tax=Collimonas pratensis TaxID=279113 RepID=UPI00143CE9D8|nr:PilC/PilY family type IV pilus protein [Collimonas pratensis]NKI72659.1 PQQ-binding-like beta-propeller repeat protein [Collimonas pratensis]
MSTPSTVARSVLLGCLGAAAFCLALAVPTFAATTDLANAPLFTSSPSLVLPNIFVMMDDSGSMNWDFLPDNNTVAYFPLGTYGYASAQCNGVFYNPSITYTLPVDYTGTAYPAPSFTNAPIDGYAGTAGGTVNLSKSFQVGVFDDGSSSSSYSGGSLQAGAPAYYYTYTGNQTSPYQKNYIVTSSKFFTECSSSPGGSSSTFTIKTTSGGSGRTGIDDITINGNSIMYNSPSAVRYPGVLGQEIIDNMANNGYSASCTAGNCSNGTRSSSAVTVTITGPYSSSPPVITQNGGSSLTISTPSAFVTPPFKTVTVSSSSGTGGTDERQNFANWYSFYRTRINMMKTSLGLAFQSIGTNYKVGYATMNNNGGHDMVNALPFSATQKKAWYQTVYGAQSNNGTGLIQALASVGKMYAHKITTLNNVAVVDPVEYSCQQNFAILSTDGYWNVASNSANLQGQPVGNQDGGDAVTAGGTAITAAPPYCDGNATCSGNSGSGSGTSNTLADVAMYYYMNDLRTSALGNCTSGSSGLNVCKDNVPTTSQDTAAWHHMTLFTLGLGAPGYMLFDPNYQTETATSTIHDYYDVANGILASDMSTCTGATCHCPWYTLGSPYQMQPSSGAAGMPCEWPTPDASGIPSNIDDLWHAAVNGRGSYFSATDPSTLAVGLANVLNAVNNTLSTSAAATTSSPNVTSTSNAAFSSSYTSGLWDGELSKQTIDINTGALSTTSSWTAAAQLDAVPYANRTIYFNSSGSLTALQWANLSAAQQAYFNTPNISTLSQFCSAGASCLSATSKTAAAGQTLLNFVLGDRTNEGLTNTNYYRVRTHVLGDIVDSQAAFVGPSLFQYTDTGYSDFITTNSTRKGVVYVGANDGMLHAFDASSGAELWAFVPTAVMPNLFALADKNYASSHQYFVDGSPVASDVYFGGAWHTILVGGLNNGGKAYYALDVTTPASPTLLWEFTDANLGYTYGNPIVTKLQNGTWVVLVTSGYNNTGGDGLGHLYVLNAQTGAIISGNTTVTPAGSATTPSGLAKISAWVNYPLVDNTSLRAYGGDLLGNVWRFDINGGTAPQLLVTLMDASSNTQAVTVAPELGNINGNAVVYVGTGRYLGVSDQSSTSQQSFYAIKDPLTTVAGKAIYTTNPQTNGSNFIAQTLTATTCPSNAPASACATGQNVITSSNNAVSFATNNGWYINFPGSGERDNTDPSLALGSVIFNTNVPSTTACTAGGTSYVYFLNYLTGGALSAAGNVVGVSQGNVLTTNASVFETSSGGAGSTAGSIRALECHSNGTCGVVTPPQNPSSSNTRRVSWHEAN